MRISGPRQRMMAATAMSVPIQVSQKLVRLRARKPSALKAISITMDWNASAGAAMTMPSTPMMDTSWCVRNMPGSRSLWHQSLA